MWNRNNNETIRDSPKKVIMKDLPDIVIKMIPCVVAMIALAVGAEEQIFKQNYIIYSISVSLAMLFIIFRLFQPFLQQPFPRSDFFPSSPSLSILFMLGCGCVVPFLLFSMISWTIAAINLVTWVFAFIILIYKEYHPELFKPVSARISQIDEGGIRDIC